MTADDEAGIHERLVLGSMWKTCALHVKIGCSLQQRGGDDTSAKVTHTHMTACYDRLGEKSLKLTGCNRNVHLSILGCINVACTI